MLWALLALNHIVDFNFLRAAAYQDFSAATKGYALPYSTSYMSLAYIASGANPLVAIVASLTFLVTMLWLTVVSLLVAQRGLFAWGMDRMGPKWFTAISPRFRSPVGMYAFCAGLSTFLCVAYWYLFPSVLSGLVASGMQLVSVFGLTAIAAIILPYRKKVSHIWDASPYKRWTVFGLPLLTIAGVVYLAYIIALLYFAFFDANTTRHHRQEDDPLRRRLGCGHALVLHLEVPQQEPGCRCGSPDLQGAAAGVKEGQRERLPVRPVRLAALPSAQREVMSGAGPVKPAGGQWRVA